MAGNMRLDIGCGKRKSPGCLGIDIGRDTDADIRASALWLPFVDASVDEIVCNHLLEHFVPEEARRFFDECRRVLVAGGRLTMKCDRDWCERWLFAKDPTHRHRYSTEECRALVRGFSESDVVCERYMLPFMRFKQKILITAVR